MTSQSISDGVDRSSIDAMISLLWHHVNSEISILFTAVFAAGRVRDRLMNTSLQCIFQYILCHSRIYCAFETASMMRPICLLCHLLDALSSRQYPSRAPLPSLFSHNIDALAYWNRPDNRVCHSFAVVKVLWNQISSWVEIKSNVHLITCESFNNCTHVAFARNCYNDLVIAIYEFHHQLPRSPVLRVIHSYSMCYFCLWPAPNIALVLEVSCIRYPCLFMNIISHIIVTYVQCLCVKFTILIIIWVVNYWFDMRSLLGFSRLHNSSPLCGIRYKIIEWIIWLRLISETQQAHGTHRYWFDSSCIFRMYLTLWL